MIRHIVMYWLKDSQNEAVIAEAVETFLSMRGRIPGLLRVEAGKDIMHSERSCDLCLSTVLESREALSAYMTHPAHLPVKAHMQTIVERSVSADFEVDAL